jgi:hypothetical protein
MSNIPILHEEHLPGGGLWSCILRRRVSLRITDIEGGANVGLMVYNAHCPSDRLNLPDTLKAQYTARLTRGHVLMSDMGRAMLSITADECGWHDPLGGHGDARLVEQKYGKRNYQTAGNQWFRNARDNFLIELGKHGLGEKDLVANLNLFSRLSVDPEGRLVFCPGNSQPGASVELRAEIHVLVVLNTCQHPLDPSQEYDPKPVKLALLDTPPAAPDDLCRKLRGENERAFALSELYFAGA